jgi:protein-disulfide isomerase
MNPAQRPGCRPLFLGTVAVLACLAAASASSLLSLARIGVLPAALPGCAVDGGCAALATSLWASFTIPGVGLRWPWAHAGTAWFLAQLVASSVALFKLRRAQRTAAVPAEGAPAYRSQACVLVWPSRVGAGVSLSLLGTMLFLRSFCVWCAVTHLASFVYWLACEQLVRSDPPRPTGDTPSGRTTGLIALLASLTLFFATVGLAIGEWAESARQQTLADRAEAEMAAEAARRHAEAGPQSGATSLAPAESDRTASPELPELPRRNPLEGRWRHGAPTAPIEIVVFSDYQCPDCRRLEADIDAVSLRSDVSVTTKHFPLCTDCNPQAARTLHPDACRRAAIAEAAGLLGGDGAFRAAHKALFGALFGPQQPTAQTAGGVSSDSDDAIVIAVAKATGLEASALKKAMAQADVSTAISDDVRDAVQLGVTFTPMIFVNGREWRWYRSKGALAELVDRVSKQAIPAVAPMNATEKMVEEWQSGRRAQGIDDASPPPFQLHHPAGEESSAEVAAPLPVVRIWLDYTVSGSTLLCQTLDGLAAEGLAFELLVYQFPASAQCNDMPGLFDGNPESCVASLAAASAGIVGGEQAFRATHDWLIAHRESIDLVDIMAVWDTLPGRRKEYLEALRAGAVTSVPVLMVDDRVVPRWDHPGSSPRAIVGGVIAAAAAERVQAAQKKDEPR